MICPAKNTKRPNKKTIRRTGWIVTADDFLIFPPTWNEPIHVGSMRAIIYQLSGMHKYIRLAIFPASSLQVSGDQGAPPPFFT
jgi:hypothetical protein